MASQGTRGLLKRKKREMFEIRSKTKIMRQMLGFTGLTSYIFKVLTLERTPQSQGLANVYQDCEMKLVHYACSFN